uniref:GTP-binding protein HflX n=1 Tax=Tetraselmis sp. GSL018 TaxID=582737 RepID=A0A061QZK5_9CHLO
MHHSRSCFSSNALPSELLAVRGWFGRKVGAYVWRRPCFLRNSFENSKNCRRLDIRAPSLDWNSWTDAPRTSDTESFDASLLQSFSKDEEDELELTQGFLQFVEKAIVVGVGPKIPPKDRSGFALEDSLTELERLADTAGLEVVGRVSQMLPEPNPRTYLGSGKILELSDMCHALGATTILCDDELSPRQQRNLEKALGGRVRVGDRTALILDVFSQRAATREGKLQVELAKVQYEFPRLTRMWTHLERQSGGGQLKGMGEKQIEVDKRLLRKRMVALQKDIDDISESRAGDSSVLRAQTRHPRLRVLVRLLLSALGPSSSGERFPARDSPMALPASVFFAEVGQADAEAAA